MKLVKTFKEKILNFLLNILILIFGIILLILIYTNIQTKILKKDFADFFGYSILEVQTGSMETAISAGDLIIIKHTQNVKLNDIITYKLKKEYITHRVIEVYTGTYITKGDANNLKDDPIDQSSVVGKVIKILPGFGIFRKTLFNPVVLIALMITLVLFNLAFKKNNSDNNLLNKITKKIKQILKNSKSKEPVSIKEDSKKDEEIQIHKVEIDPETEERLTRTQLYKTVAFDENSEEQREYEVIKEQLKQEELKKQVTEEDLEKTTLYRVVSVDSSEINNTLLEIAENKIKNAEQKSITNETTITPIVEEVTEENSNEINLDLLKNKKNNKGKNIINTAMIIKQEELNEITNVILEENYNKKFSDLFINNYLNVKYYNSDGESDIEYNNSIVKIKKYIHEVANNLANTVSNSKTKIELVKTYYNTFILIAGLDQAKDSITDLKVKREFYKKEFTKYFKEWNLQVISLVVEQIIKIQRKYDNTLEYYLKKLETNMFNLNINKVNSRNNIYALNLEHNIAFSKVYSDYIIDKTYSEGIVAEDKIEVLLTLLLGQLVTDMVTSKFNKKYIIYIPETLYPKEKKLIKILNMMDDRYAKNNIYLLLDFKILLNNKQIIKNMRKDGYKFALTFDDNVKIDSKNSSNIYIADYIFLNKENNNINKILSFIPEELLGNIIYDNIEEKVGGFGGE